MIPFYKFLQYAMNQQRFQFEILRVRSFPVRSHKG